MPNSYTADFRLKVIAFKETNDKGNRGADERYKVDPKRVREWRRNKAILQAMKPSRRALPRRDEITVDCVKNGFIKAGICEGVPTNIEMDVQEDATDIEMVNDCDSEGEADELGEMLGDCDLGSDSDEEISD